MEGGLNLFQILRMSVLLTFETKEELSLITRRRTPAHDLDVLESKYKLEK